MFEKFKNRHPALMKVLFYGGVAVCASLVVVGGYKVHKNLTKTPPMGRDNPRAHVRKDGKEKVGYDNKERANAQAMWDNFIHGTDMTAYECPICGKFHVGHDHAAKSA